MIYETSGVICVFSDRLIEALGGSQDCGEKNAEALVECFLGNEPPDQIRWVGEDEIRDPSRKDEEIPMYTMQNSDGTICVLFWPVLKEGRRCLAIQLREERPSLEGVLDWSLPSPV